MLLPESPVTESPVGNVILAVSPLVTLLKETVKITYYFLVQQVKDTIF
jgi:hypothetical protein